MKVYRATTQAEIQKSTTSMYTNSNDSNQYICVASAVTKLEYANLPISKIRQKKPIMQTVNEQHIRVGDIIKLKQHQTAPCDLLVLASSDLLFGKYSCKVQTVHDDGKSQETLREAVGVMKPYNSYSTHEDLMEHYLKKLNAKVHYSHIHDRDEIEGTFKLKDDPKFEEISGKKIVRKGSVLKSQYIIGLVLYNGQDCFINQPAVKDLVFKRSKIEKRLVSFTLQVLFFNLISAIASSLFYRRVRTLEGSQEGRVSSVVGFITHLTLYLSTMPLTVSIFLHTTSLISTFFLQTTYRGIQKKEVYTKLLGESDIKEDDFDKLYEPDTYTNYSKESFKILNPGIVSDLGDIDDAFFDKTQTLTVRKLAVGSVFFANKYFTSDKEFYDSELANLIFHTNVETGIETREVKKRSLKKNSGADLLGPPSERLEGENIKVPKRLSTLGSKSKTNEKNDFPLSPMIETQDLLKGVSINIDRQYAQGAKKNLELADLSHDDFIKGYKFGSPTHHRIFKTILLCSDKNNFGTKMLEGTLEERALKKFATRFGYSGQRVLDDEFSKDFPSNIEQFYINKHGEPNHNEGLYFEIPQNTSKLE